MFNEQAISLNLSESKKKRQKELELQIKEYIQSGREIRLYDISESAFNNPEKKKKRINKELFL